MIGFRFCVVECFPSRYFIFTFLLFLCTTDVIESYTKEDWYTKYGTNYPEYCSTTEQMLNRVVPDFPADDPRIGETRLVHVSAITRHGARTPIHVHKKCWDGYYESLDTTVWECSLTTSTTPPKQSTIDRLGTSSSSSVVAGDNVYFENKYDALMHSTYGLSNHLNGTCLLGQLIEQGYDQLLTVGKHLRDAYVYDGSNHNHDIRMRLIDISGGVDGGQSWYDEKNIHFRSTNLQRTINSGQTLISGMFLQEINNFYNTNKNKNREAGDHINIPIHLTDTTRDILYPNEELCPRLEEIRTQIENSREYKSFNNSKEAHTLREFMEDELGADEEIDIYDCLMPVLCTDRDLPDAIIERGLDPNVLPKNPSRYGAHLLSRMLSFAAKRELIHLQANDAGYSKLAMGPLWTEIIKNVDFAESPPVKFALYSGHDSTIMPLLASLGPNVYTDLHEEYKMPSYAATILIEIHEHIDGQTDREVYKSKQTFRLIYDGQVVTNRVDGCPDDAQLCDVAVLLKIVGPFAVENRDCSRRHETTTKDESSSLDKWLFIHLMVVFLGVIFGAVGASLLMTGSIIPPTLNDYSSI